MTSNKAAFLSRVILGTIPRMDSVLPLCIKSDCATCTARPLGTKAGNRQDAEADKDADHAENGSSFAPKSGGAEYGKVQEEGENVAEEMEKKWKLKQEQNKDDMITFKDIGVDSSQRAHPDGDE